MSSHSTQLFLSARLHLLQVPTLRPTSSFSALNQPKYLPGHVKLISPRIPPPFLTGVWLFGANDKRVFRYKCSAVSKPRSQEYAGVLQNGLPVIKWPEIVEDDIEGDEAAEDFGQINKIKQHVETVKSMLESMEDGEITISAYDTAWVALVEDMEGSGLPQFPSSLQWIANNQLPDGSWGDSEIFNAHDRILNTIACVVALESWSVHPDKCEKVPNVYPVDLFEHIWVVDRLQRLGISRYFEPQLKECVNYVSRYWTEKGICWARNSEVQDIDDTAMAFRLLRLHGHQVSPDVFKHFKKGNKFICFAGQSTQAVTGMYNLFRASQVLFPGETILEEAKDFSTKFLREKQASNELLDKWVIANDLPGEVAIKPSHSKQVGYALDFPWYASLPRLETRFYIQQYGGRDDVWIGKTLYRWYAECKLENYGLSRRSLLMAYFVAAASIFEPERANERLAWAKTASLIETIGSHFKEGTSQRKAFVHEFKTRKVNTNKKEQGLVETLLATLHRLSFDAMVAHGQDISHPLRQAWEKWLLKWQEQGDMHQDEAELLVETINQTAGLLLSNGLLLSIPEHEQLFKITNTVCNKLRYYQNQNHKVNENGGYIKATQEIELEMQQLVQMVLQNPLDGAIESSIKQTFFAVARSFYYSAYSDAGTINSHLAKVLFERVD
ncbi:hypothetical protein DVH24_002838 [Malus domestica]|uniref:Ent-copalyl diphosphate synthase n=1 Tax=Malus domestica TaxID=3750 RepID=A0A498K3I7_MALDO|nr:hypothetical protein DVH24_002838 [Malus domestica]